VYLKYENLQPINSFKLRAAANVLSIQQEKGNLNKGVWTASAGNMAAGVAWMANKYKIPCTVVVPDHAPESKLLAITRIYPSTRIVKIPWSKWWNIIETHSFEDQSNYNWDFGYFVHPVCNREVQSGNGTIGIEIHEDLPDVDSIIVPYGGGALSTGIASALKALSPHCKIYASEVSTSAALKAAFDNGKPTKIEYQPSFVDGIGSGEVLHEMWPIVKDLLLGSIVCSLEEVAAAINILVVKNKVIAEGAGGSAVAAALKMAKTGELGEKIVCVISGGGLNPEHIITILQGNVPVPKKHKL